MSLQKVVLWVIAIIVLVVVFTSVSIGLIRLLAIIGILVISFVLLGTIIRIKK